MEHIVNNEKGRPIVEVLISAMDQEDLDIITTTGVNTSALLINQCACNMVNEEKRTYGVVRCISTTERGLSRSRNMALDNARGKYCLICDDDETLVEEYAKIIEEGFNKHPDAGIICFQVKNPRMNYSNKPHRIGYIRSLKVASWQIAMQTDVILQSGIKFDTRFGSGTPLGSGEENIFMYDCLKKGIKIFYEPKCIGSVAQEKSQWFKGFDEQYFINKGTIVRRIMGSFWGFTYCVYFIISKKKRYASTITPMLAWKSMMKGFKRSV